MGNSLKRTLRKIIRLVKDIIVYLMFRQSHGTKYHSIILINYHTSRDMDVTEVSNIYINANRILIQGPLDQYGNENIFRSVG